MSMLKIEMFEEIVVCTTLTLTRPHDEFKSFTNYFARMGRKLCVPDASKNDLSET
jgi:hypothetical protein